MGPSEVVESGGVLISWFNDYGALQIMAMIGIISCVAIPACCFILLIRVGRPIAKLATYMEDMDDMKTEFKIHMPEVKRLLMEIKAKESVG